VFGVGVGELADRVLEAWAAEAGDGGGRGRWPSLLSCSAWSAGDGRFALRDVPAGVAIRIVACVRGRPLGVLPARVLRPGEVVQDIELRLPQ
jgi:hypothetical protein